ncbi:MAG: nucleotide sugar dehydrogenase [Pseudomonadota bacterium]
MAQAQETIAVIGLGYVGLPLAVAFAANRRVVGFDIDQGRIAELKRGSDRTGEVGDEELAGAKNLTISSSPPDIRDCQIFIVTVPTPITADKTPDLSQLLAASETVAGALKPGDIVVYESTVFPGATEDECVPVLEQSSGLTFNEDFFAGYSPERINPGDKAHRIADITKVVAGSRPHVTERLADLYGEIVGAGIHRAESIRVAEAAKVIENTQRDLNIALINELSIIFRRMGLDTEAVLKAAGTKWNFQPFRPGLVGGHCIGVDPYYLTYKAESIGYSPEIILAGRQLNDSMASYACGELLAAMQTREIPISGACILIMGVTFKENTPDARNSQVVSLVSELRGTGAIVDIWDPRVDRADLKANHGLSVIDAPEEGVYDCVVIAVAHDEFRNFGAAKIRSFGKPEHILYDLKYVLAPDESDLRL